MKKFFTPSSIIVLSIVAIAAAARFFPHPVNFTPIAAMAIFAGAYSSKKYFAMMLPVAAMLITDSFLGFYPEMWGVYVALVLSVLLGFTLRRKKTVLGVVGISLVSSITFFAVSNFAVWAGGLCGYPHTMEGLATCYTMAIPFFRNEVLGTLVYSGVFFGLYEAISRTVRTVKVK
ncbi:MAG: hypothetical protein LBQ31_01495 [Bacteroidales bacterium]|jgi:hypothetical protein|nr:hypothetical protein [Bacteroidales bacterium]